ncbi:MAG: hypothetical protein IVW57_17410, partial [Ktedonobacterales bacterium]|nr:hypothetical protein [Ktedonobacterales bacterium]
MASEHSPGMPPSPLEPPPGGEEWPRAYPSRPPTGPYPPYPAVPYIPPMQQVPKGRRGGVPWYVWVIGGCLGLLVLLVIACVVFAGVFTGIAIKYSRQVAVTDTTAQTLPKHGVPTLDIRDSYATVTLQQGSGKQVT